MFFGGENLIVTKLKPCISNKTAGPLTHMCLHRHRSYVLISLVSYFSKNIVMFVYFMCFQHKLLHVPLMSGECAFS